MQTANDLNRRATNDAMLVLDGVRKEYAHPGGAVSVLKGVDASVRRGETVAVLGPSGSGKSTLLSLLAGLDKPTTGRIAVQGDDIAKMSERELTKFRARNLGIVFQQFHLMAHLSALENVALPLDIAGDQEARAKAEAALGQVGLAHRLKHYPYELSGGECQRVAIARAFIARPPLVLADEPSGNLDNKTGDQVMKLLFDLVRAHGMTMILVTHNESLASWCDRRLVLREGRLVDE